VAVRAQENGVGSRGVRGGQGRRCRGNGEEAMEAAMQEEQIGTGLSPRVL
jgi:hypothetical protein